MTEAEQFEIIELKKHVLAMTERINKLTLLVNNQQMLLSAQTELVTQHAEIIAALDLKEYLLDEDTGNVIDFIQRLEEKQGGTSNG